MTIFSKLKHMHVLRWVLILVLGFLLFWLAMFSSFFLALFGLVTSFDVSFGFLYTFGLALFGSMLAPRYRMQTLLILIGVSGVVFWKYLSVGDSYDSGAIIGILAGGTLAFVLLRLWDPMVYGPKHWKRFLLAFAGMVIVASLVVTLRFMDFPAIRDSTDYAGIPVRGFYSVDRGGFIDSAEVWRIDADPPTIALIANKLGAKEVTDVPQQFFGYTPFWWPHRLPAHYRAWKTSGFSFDERGNDGSYYFLLYDNDKERGYVWVQNNF